MRPRRDKRIALRALCPSLLFGSSIKSLTDNSSYDSIPEVLYQNNISKGKGKKI